MNENIEVVGSNAVVIDDNETALSEQVSSFELQAKSIEVVDDESFSYASAAVKQIKAVEKKVKDYWEPLRVNAKKAYDTVLGRKKEMLDPLEAAEKIIKGKMGDYSLKKERERKAQEELMRKLAQEEMNKKLEEAAKAEEAGDDLAAEFAMSEAEVMENIAVTGTVQSAAPKVSGVSQSKSWEIVKIDESAVPVSVNGTVIRPVDDKAIMRLIRQTKGQVVIPGVEFKETVSISVRS